VIAAAISHQLLSAATRVQAQISSCGLHCGLSSTGVGFLLALLFPLRILILPNVSFVKYKKQAFIEARTQNLRSLI
jgi:hypothetical protein